MASKIRAFMKKPYALLIACAVFCALATTAQAEKADKDKPMNIEADSMRYDDLKQVNVFTGKVQMIKGTILSRGARVDIRKDPQGYQYGVVTAEPGKLAYFRQKREGVDEYIEGEAELIEYDSKADNVKFIRRAVLRRYIGTVLNDEVTGGLIVYDNSADVFTVDPGAPGTAGASGRVRAVLTPQPAASAAAAPTGPAPVLRPSKGLAGEKK
jgi:lipopolysaccharide export system protein LptA